jgi:hypothetical protein
MIKIIGGSAVERDIQEQTDKFFKCLSCGHVTKVTADPPTCERCRTGAGIVSEVPSPGPSATAANRKHY